MWTVGLCIVQHRDLNVHPFNLQSQPAGLQDTTHLFVLWSGHGTQLEYAQGPASFKTSLYQGVDILAFSEDRSQVCQCRDLDVA